MADNSWGGGVGGEYFVTVTQSKVSGNSTSGFASRGGGVWGAYVQLSQCTISDNSASGEVTFGGGVRAMRGGFILNSTITANGAPEYGGVYLPAITGRLFSPILHSIIAGNSGSSFPDLLAIPNISYSLIGDTTDFTDAQRAALLARPGNHLDVDPLLGPLAYNGGPVFLDGSRMLTHALLPGSPAIDAGDPNFDPNDPDSNPNTGEVMLNDQRGMPFSRVWDGDVQESVVIDIGALESQPNPLPGDYNYNGRVDAADYTTWRDLVGTSDPRADGSGSVEGVPDGVVDQYDYAFWKANFGNVYSPGAAGAALMEPAARVGQGAGGGEQGVAEGGRPPLLFSEAAPRNSRRTTTDTVAIHARQDAAAMVVRRDEALAAWLAGRRLHLTRAVPASAMVPTTDSIDDAREPGIDALDEALAQQFALV